MLDVAKPKNVVGKKSYFVNIVSYLLVPTLLYTNN